MRLPNSRETVPSVLCCLLILSSSLRAAVTIDSASDTIPGTNHVGRTISPTLAAQLAAVEELPTIDPTNLPNEGRSAGYFSAQRPLDPPAPGNIFSLPVWDLGDQVYLLDDVDFNYAEATVSYQANGATPMSVSGPPAPGGGGGTNSGGGGTPYLVVFTTNQLWLQVTTTNLSTYLVIHAPWNTTNGVWDIFATTNLAPSAWRWVDRCAPGQTNITLIGMAYPNEFFIAASTNDTDGDGLSDAFETLVSHTNPNLPSTDGTGMSDGWELQYFGCISNNPAGDPDGDGLTTYQEFQMRSKAYNPLLWDSNTNSVVGDGFQDYSGDGLANLLEGAFGGNMLTSNPTWKVDSDGDGLPDLYKTMVGVSTSTPPPAPGLPIYSKNPVP